MTFRQHCSVGWVIGRGFGLAAGALIVGAWTAYVTGVIAVDLFLPVVCLGLGSIIAGTGTGVSYVVVSVVGDVRRARRSR